MKLWHSFTKELLLASRSYYFYMELVMAGIFLFLLLLVIPESFETRQDEYIYLDVPAAAYQMFEGRFLEEDADGKVELVEFEMDGETHTAQLFQAERSNYYLFDDQQAAIALADKERAFAGIIHMNDFGEISYTYYMQGYETERLRNTFAVLHNENAEILAKAFETQEVRVLHENQFVLSDRDNIVPSFLTFNGSLMGMFVLAAYIFLDKKEGVIKAYAVSTSPVWQYLLSKVGVVTLTSMLTSLIITIPVLGGQPNYLVLLVFLLTTGFAASGLGLLLSSFYEDITQSFGVLYGLIILLMLPNIAYFIPTWDPAWMQFIPTYPMLHGFKEIILPDGDITYALTASLGFLAAGLIIFIFANKRFKKTLTI